MTDRYDEILASLVRGERVADSALTALAEGCDVHRLGQAALAVKRGRYGEVVTWINNIHINYTNLCSGQCAFCRFRRSAGEAGAYRLSVDEILLRAERAVSAGATEIHLTGGLDEGIDLDGYMTIVRRLRERFGETFIKAYTAVEIDFMADRAGVDVETVLRRLKEAGLGSLAGGGAEIFSDRVRGELYPGKISGQRWLEIHRLAHGVGLTSNATMLIGHIERMAERVRHLLALRALQDETGGLRAFLVLPVSGFSEAGVGGVDLMRTLAISRLVLDNVAHIKVFWPIWTVKLAQLGLSYGADVFDGTVGSYGVVKQADGLKRGMSTEGIVGLIEDAGFSAKEQRRQERSRRADEC